MDRENLINFFSEFWEIEPSKITDSLRLNDINIDGLISIKLYQFFAEVESKFGIKFKNVAEIVTFGDILKYIKS